MGHEIAQETTSALVVRLPTLQALSRRLVFEVPGHDDVPEASDRATVQDCLSTPPRCQLWEVEIDDDGSCTLAGALEDHLRASEIRGKRFLEEDRFSEVERALGDGGLEMGRYCHGDHCNRWLVNYCLPVPKPVRNVFRAGEFGRACRVSSPQRDDLAAAVRAECRHQYRSSVIAADDANANQDWCSAMLPLTQPGRSHCDESPSSAKGCPSLRPLGPDFICWSHHLSW